MDDIVVTQYINVNQNGVNDIAKRLMQWSLITYRPPTSFDLPDDLIEAADLIATLQAGIERLRAVGDSLVAAIRNHDLREEHLKAWEEARRG